MGPALWVQDVAFMNNLITNYHPLVRLLDQQTLLRVFLCPIFINEMKKQVKLKTEQTALINVLAKLQEKYEQVQSKTLNDAITHLQAAIRSLNCV
jgi:hypothetical protein